MVGELRRAREMSPKVLVLEDELLIAMDVLDELEDSGFEPVGPFASVSQAMAYCEQHTPDCAVLDVRVRDGESYILADVLAQRRVPIVFHSGHAGRNTLAERYDLSAICPKPAASSQLSEIVAKLVGRRH